MTRSAPEPLYLDWCATTPLAPEVLAAYCDALRAGFANPASQHWAGQRARRELERLRRDIVEFLGGRPGRPADRLVLTSGGTESNHLAIAGLADPSRPRIIVSSIEHPSVAGAARIAAQRGFEVVIAPVDRCGMVDLGELERLTAERPTGLVSLMLVNNETGVIQPVARAAAICRAAGALFHTDAVQAVGKLACSLNELGVDALTFTAHKIGGPRGVGGLLLRHGVEPVPLMIGGQQQSGLRPGTEDVALAAALHRAVELAVGNLPAAAIRVAGARDAFESSLREVIRGPFEVIASDAPRACHVSNVAFPGIDRQALLLAADSNGLAIATGSACASGSSEPSPVLRAMGLPAGVIDSAVRVSFGAEHSAETGRDAAVRLGQIVNRLRDRSIGGV